MALPTTAGTNCWTNSEDLLAEILSSCLSVQAFLGVPDANSAKAGNMYIDSIGAAAEEYTDAEWSAFFPNLIIGSPGDDADVFVMTARSSGYDFAATGNIEVIFATLLDEADEETEQERQFKNFVGDIIEELTNKDMAMPAIAVQAYGRNPEDQHERMGVILSCRTIVRWGTEFSGEGD